MKKYLRIIGIIIFVVVIYQYKYVDILKNNFSIYSYKIYFISFFLYLMYLFIDAVRLKTIYSLFDVKVKYFAMFLLYNASYYIALMTPGNIGGLIKIFYLQNYKYSFKRITLSFFFEKLFDIIFISFLGFIGILILKPELYC